METQLVDNPRLKVFKILWISFPGFSHIDIGSSDPSLIQFFFSEIKKIIPTIEFDVVHEKDLDGNIVVSGYRKLGGKDREIHYWILQKILSMGWEPFNIIQQESMHLPSWIFFRKEE